MSNFFEILFLQLYQWFKQDALSESNAAIHVIYFLSLFYTANVLSVYWVLESLTQYSPRIFSGDSSNLIPLLIAFLIVFVLYIAFVKKKKYLFLYKKTSLKNVRILRLKPKAFTLLYILVSILLFVGTMILGIKVKP